MTDKVRVFINDVMYEVPKGANLVDVAKQYAGDDIPVFCYHPKMAPVGMCRMCLVETGQAQIIKESNELQRDEAGNVLIKWIPKLQTACTMTVTDGMSVRTNTPAVLIARKDILEFILTSHPLDCPICDKGGECPLQNLTLRHGPGTSRFVFDEKLRLDKHYPLGDLIFLDRERCIQCARCTRFQDELVGDPVLGFHERGRYLQIVTTSNPPFDTYFSGNTTDICPVGALTTADFRFGARIWELTETPSICPHCPVGCNISATTRLDRDSGGKVVIKRIMPRQNEAVNEIWICDKGRFGHHHAQSAERLTMPLIRKNGELTSSTWNEAYALIAQNIQQANGSVGAIAGPMTSNEDLWTLRRMVEAGGGNQLGVWPYYMTGADMVAAVGLTKGSNFKEMGKGTTIVVVASDLEEEAPVWYLRVKNAADRGARVITVNARATELDRWAKQQIRYPFGDAVLGLDKVELGDAQNVVVMVGGEGQDRANHYELMKAAAYLIVKSGRAGQHNSGLIAVWPGANTQGAFDLGFSAEATEAMLKARPSVLFLVDADPLGEDALQGLEAGFTVVSEMFMTPSAAAADVVLPRQSFAERDGSFTSGERRVQRFYSAVTALDNTQPDWRAFEAITAKLNGARPKLSAAAVMQEITQHVAIYAGMSYPQLARTEPQYPDVGGHDLYYGGTAYHNGGGLGVQWAVQAESGDLSAVKDGRDKRDVKVNEGELLIVPVVELYNRQPEFAASEHLMAAHIDAPYIVLSNGDAQKLHVVESDLVAVSYADHSMNAIVRVDHSLPIGIALVGRYLSTQPEPMAPVAGSVRKVEVVANV